MKNLFSRIFALFLLPVFMLQACTYQGLFAAAFMKTMKILKIKSMPASW